MTPKLHEKEVRQPQAGSELSTQQVKPKSLILTGYGLNCDYETEYVFKLAGAHTDVVHINDLISGLVKLEDYQILAFIGGFAWADDHGAGVILATKLRRHLGDQLVEFVQSGCFIIGICNGFQALVNLGLLPGFAAGKIKREVALTDNDCGNYRDEWVHLRVEDSPCVFTKGISQIDMPIRHSTGKFIASPEVIGQLEMRKQIVLRYAFADGDPAGSIFPWNPNGSMNDIAGICDPTGRVFGLMPHPEAFNHATNHPDWTREVALAKPAERDLAKYGEGAGVKLFRNVVAAAAATIG